MFMRIRRRKQYPNGFTKANFRPLCSFFIKRFSQIFLSRFFFVCLGLVLYVFCFDRVLTVSEKKENVIHSVRGESIFQTKPYKPVIITLISDRFCAFRVGSPQCSRIQPVYPIFWVYNIEINSLIRDNLF